MYHLIRIKQAFKKTVLLLSCIALLVSCLNAQTHLPVIRATSKHVKIRDGDFLKDWWYIMPEAKPDRYWVDFPRKEQEVTFITDTDSITFKVRAGQTYDFVILLNGTDSAFTQISGTRQKQISYTETNLKDSIPFTVHNYKIYFDGKINGSENLKIQFDLGAGMSNINAKSTHKINMRFDTVTYLINSDGRNKARVSSANEIAIGKLTIRPDAFVESRNMSGWEDAIIGNSLFLDKYLEIDYCKQMVYIHDSMPETDSTWTKVDMLLDGGVRPMLKATIEADGVTGTDWFIFDTGDSGNGILSNEFTEKHDLYNRLKKIIGFGDRKIAGMPKIDIAGFDFESGTIVLEKTGSAIIERSVIGNKILSRFNVIIDNVYGNLYLKPNHSFKK